MATQLFFKMIFISVFFLVVKNQYQPYGSAVNLTAAQFSGTVAISGDGSTIVKSLRALAGGYQFQRYKITSFQPYTLARFQIFNPPGNNILTLANRYMHLNINGLEFFFADKGTQYIMFFKADSTGAFSSTPTTLIPYPQKIDGSNYKNGYLCVNGATTAKVYQVQNGILVYLKDVLPNGGVTGLISFSTSGTDNLYALATDATIYIKQFSPTIDEYSLALPTALLTYQMEISEDQLTILVGQTYGLHILSRLSKNDRFQIAFSSDSSNSLCNNIYMLKMINNGDYVFYHCQIPNAVRIAQKNADKTYTNIMEQLAFNNVDLLSSAISNFGRNFVYGTSNFAVTYKIQCITIFTNLCSLAGQCISPCSTCSLVATNCTGCVSGFVPIPVNGQCTLCTSPCLTCSKSATFCLTCVGGGSANSGSCCISPCSTCLGTACTACVPGYVPVNSVCIACISPCLTCQGTANNCVSCVSKYYYNPTQKRCRACPTNCVNCYLLNGNVKCQ